MIAPEESQGQPANTPFPNSKRVYVEGAIHADVRVPMREISLANTKSMDGRMEENEPVRVYDTSGPWGDENFNGDVERGLPMMRSAPAPTILF